MTDLAEILEGAGFRTALIIDDAFDERPCAADLALDDGAWAIFIDDIHADHEVIAEAFPRYADMGANELRQSDEFVRILYGSRDTLRPALWNTLFETYEGDRAGDREFLTRLERRLAAAGLQVRTSGRQVPADARDCSIIFADLFLGSAHRDFDVQLSIDRLRTLLAGRETAPPAVVLMSSSPLLTDKKQKFRDDAKLVGALFRVYGKRDLLEGSTVETVLERLATHHADGVRVAAFLTKWEEGLAGATAGFMKLMRRLDLSDYSKIRELLLDAEGQPLGSYMLDVFDRVLQHEIEGDAATIDAALELNAVDSKKYPAPYIAGSPDLQDLVARSLWQNVERLKVAGNTAGMPVSFGDVLVRRSRLNPTAAAQPPDDNPDVLIVLTPACDLMRNPEKRRVLLVGGTLKTLDAKTWKYKSKAATTSIVQLVNQPRMFIEWDFDDQRMLKQQELVRLISPEGPYHLRLRLRENNALALQQQLLSDMGRVGLASKMPFTFAVEVRLFTIDTDGKARALELPITTREGGVCIIGRDGDGDDLTRVAFTEGSIDEILKAILQLEEGRIHARARDALRRLKASTTFRSLLQQGLPVPVTSAKKPLKPLKVAASAGEGEARYAEEIVGLIGRNPGDLDIPSGDDQKNGALIVVLNDHQDVDSD